MSFNHEGYNGEHTGQWSGASLRLNEVKHLIGIKRDTPTISLLQMISKLVTMGL